MKTDFWQPLLNDIAAAREDGMQEIGKSKETDFWQRIFSGKVWV